MDIQSPFGFEGFTDLGLRSAAEMRPILLRVLTDLYVQRLSHTPDEERHYSELALRLLDVVDVPTRIAVSMRLARHLAPPLQVLRRLARDLPEVAAPLRAHPLLQPHASADETAPLPAAAIVAAGDGPDAENTFARAPGAIDRATAGELNELFFAADANERRLILLSLDVVVPAQAGGVGVSPDPSVGRRLEAAALSRNREDFAHQLALALHIAREQARRIVRDDLGEPVVVAAKALGLTRDVLYRILLFLNPAVGHSVERVHGLATLYDEMRAAAAADMVAIWQALPRNERAKVKYQPLASDGEAHWRSRPAAIAAQRSPAAPRTGGRRNAS